MVKVCHMTSVHPPKDVRIFHKECVSLAESGYDTYLVEQGNSMYEDGVHIIGVGELPKGRLKRVIFGSKIVYEKAKQVDADIYHLHDPELLLYAVKLKRLGKKVVFDSHEYYRVQIRGKKNIPRWLSGLIANVYGRYEDYILRKIDGIVFPCTYHGEHPFSGKCKHLAIVNNTPMMKELYDKYDKSIEKFDNSVCYVGSLTHSRGVTNSVKATYKSNSILYLAGKFHSDEYKESIFKSKEFQNTKYLGVISRDEVLDLLQHSKVGLATLLNEGQYNAFDNLPTKAYEYMSLGIPVILSHSQYNDKIMEKFNFGICVDPNNIEEISDAIKELLNNNERAKLMGNNGRTAIKNKFNWTLEFKNLLELYAKIQSDI